MAAVEPDRQTQALAPAMIPALVPLKPLALAKSRLATVLTPAQRAALARAMAADVLDRLVGHPGIGPVVVCGRDASARELAHAGGALYLDERDLGQRGLNPVVAAAAQHLARAGAQELLIVHGDLPLLRGEDLDRFLRAHARAARHPAALTLAPDRWGRGTNLMAWRAPHPVAPRYGTNSLQRHRELAHVLGARLTVCPLPGAGIDIDEAADLIALCRHADDRVAARTRFCLRRTGLSAPHALLLTSSSPSASPWPSRLPAPSPG